MPAHRSTNRGLPGALAAVLCLTGPVHLAAQSSQPTGAYGAPVAVCVLQDPRIREASGIAASRRNPGCYYVHNDSGDQPRVFLVDRRGRTRLTIRLRGAQAIDYEDIALAPGQTPGTFDVCVADIGDNRRSRSNLTIYRFPEVALDDERDGQVVDVEPVAYRIRYADGPADAEAFCVHPRSGDGYILTKAAGVTAVYRMPAPWDAGQESVLSRLLDLKLPPAPLLARIVTAADIAPDGRRLAVRCYLDGWEWCLPEEAADSDFQDIFQTVPQRLSLPAEPQAEALCYSADGRALLTISEGSMPTLHEVPRAPSTTRPDSRACRRTCLAGSEPACMLGMAGGAKGKSLRAPAQAGEGMR